MLTRDWMDCDEPPRSFRERGLDPYSRGPWPPERCRFYLGAHRLNWLWRGLARGPLFVNVHLMLSKSDERKANFGAGLFVRPTPLERATVDIGLDSGGYTELKDYGLWRWSAAEHVWLVRRMFRELGRVDFAAPQDWPCGDETLRRTGLSVVEHQERTLRAYLEMMRLAPEIPWAPVLQGGAPIDFLRHVEAYQRAGIDLWTFQRVLLGSIAYRDDDPLIYQVVQALQRTGIALHALGAKEDAHPFGGFRFRRRIASAVSSLIHRRKQGIVRFSSHRPLKPLRLIFIAITNAMWAYFSIAAERRSLALRRLASPRFVIVFAVRDFGGILIHLRAIIHFTIAARGGALPGFRPRSTNSA